MRKIIDNFQCGMSHDLANVIINNILSAITKVKKLTIKIYDNV